MVVPVVGVMFAVVYRADDPPVDEEVRSFTQVHGAGRGVTGRVDADGELVAAVVPHFDFVEGDVGGVDDDGE